MLSGWFAIGIARGKIMCGFLMDIANWRRVTQ